MAAKVGLSVDLRLSKLVQFEFRTKKNKMNKHFHHDVTGLMMLIARTRTQGFKKNICQCPQKEHRNLRRKGLVFFEKHGLFLLNIPITFSENARSF